MPSSAHTDSVERSSTMRRRIASRSVGGSRSMPASDAGELLALLGDLVGARLLAGDAVCGAFAALVVVERVVMLQVAAAQRVDDLVLQHRRQPRAQRGAAAEAGAAREDGFDHVVDRVLGERRVAQLAQGEADEVGPVRDQLGDRDRHRVGALASRRCRQGARRRGGAGGEGGESRAAFMQAVRSVRSDAPLSRPEIAPSSRKITPASHRCKTSRGGETIRACRPPRSWSPRTRPTSATCW